MRKELKSIAEYRKPSNDAFASVTRSFGEANNRFHALAAESVGRAVEIQSQFVAKAYDTYISEISKLGRMFFVGYRTFTAQPQALPYANLKEKKPPIGSRARRLKPMSAPRDRPRRRGKPVQSAGAKASFSG